MGVGKIDNDEWPAAKRDSFIQRSGERSWNMTRLPKKSWIAPRPSNTSLPKRHPKEGQGTLDNQTKTT